MLSRDEAGGSGVSEGRAAGRGSSDSQGWFRLDAVVLKGALGRMAGVGTARIGPRVAFVIAEVGSKNQ